MRNINCIKTGCAVLTVLILFATAGRALARCDDQAGFAKQACEAAQQPTPASLVGSSASSEAITTGIADALRPDTLDASINPRAYKPLVLLHRSEDGAFLLERGIYGAEIESYALDANLRDAGAPAAYFPAPFRGSKASLIASALKNAELHRDLAQSDIQQLLTGLIVGANFVELPASVQQAAAALLPPDVVKQMRSQGQKQRLEKHAKDILRQQLGRVTGVKANKAPELGGSAPDTGSPSPALHGVFAGEERGTWAEMPGGFYVRYLPEGGGKTLLEVFVPDAATQLADAGHPLSFDPTQYVAVLAVAPYPRLGFTVRQPMGPRR